jgi:uncharacterized membrane protein
MANSMERPTHEGLKSSRIEALTDGVFAVIMTLLILDLRVPEIAAAQVAAKLPAALLALWPKLFSYALSFVMAGVFWVGHHNVLHFVRRSDRVFLWINILFLMTITFIPFSASLIGRYPRSRVAVVLYGANLIASTLTLYLTWRYPLSGHRLVDPDVDPEVIRGGSQRILIAPVVHSVGILAALIRPELGLAIFVLAPAVWIFPWGLDRHLTPTRGSAGR